MPTAKSFLISAGLLISAATATAGERKQIPMTPELWQTDTGVFEKIQGVDAIALRQGMASPKGVSLRDGTIEFDVQPFAMGTGLAFRRQNEENFEYFYIRPNGRCGQSNDCLQYAPETRGVLLWDVFPQYQAPAPIRDGEWNHIKIVLSGQRMNIYVNREKAPSLKIGRLEGETSEGTLSLQGPGYFANFSITPDATEGLVSEPEADPTSNDPHFLRDWQLSPVSELPTGKDPSFEDLPAASARWVPIAAERGGLVNISRQYGLPLERPRRSLVWIKTSLSSDKAQSIKTSIGWVREVWVFVNGKLVYSDKNLYMPASARKAPDGRCSLENGSFELPLAAGQNEIAIAVATNFYGLAVIVRPDDVTGLALARK